MSRPDLRVLLDREHASEVRILEEGEEEVKNRGRRSTSELQVDDVTRVYE